MYESQGVLLHFLKSAGDVEVSIHNNFDESEGFDCLNHACVWESVCVFNHEIRFFLYIVHMLRQN